MAFTSRRSMLPLDHSRNTTTPLPELGVGATAMPITDAEAGPGEPVGPDCWGWMVMAVGAATGSHAACAADSRDPVAGG